MPFNVETIAIGSDHRARDIVDGLANYLEPLGWTVHKYYGEDGDSVDYPCIAEEVTNVGY